MCVSPHWILQCLGCMAAAVAAFHDPNQVQLLCVSHPIGYCNVWGVWLLLSSPSKTPSRQAPATLCATLHATLHCLRCNSQCIRMPYGLGCMHFRSAAAVRQVASLLLLLLLLLTQAHCCRRQLHQAVHATTVLLQIIRIAAAAVG